MGAFIKDGEKMKVRKQKEIPAANRIFTDREEPREAFWKNYRRCEQELCADAEIHVLTYYGIGGIGKSSLLKKLMSELESKIAEPLYVYFDFNIYQESRSVLSALKNKLSERYGYHFPLFELGMYVYARKIGEDAQSPEIKAFVDKSPFLNLVASLAGKIPVVSMATEFLTLADKGLAYVRTYLNNHRRELSEIEYKDAAELYQYLPYLFSQDMENNLKHTNKPLVVLLDTYERLVNEMSSVGEPLNNDLWLRGEEGLIQNIPNTLWVIAGREKMRWERFDPEWNSALEQHLLGNLSPADSDRFLMNAGISNAALRNQLYALTNGTPIYLDLCVDRFLALLEKGVVPRIEDFGSNIYHLIETFFRYMDDSKKDIMYLLSCLGRWNDDMVEKIAGKSLSNFSDSAYEKVKDFSFVIQSDEYYTIHQTMQTALLSSCPVALKERTAQAAIAYFTEKISSMNRYAEDYSTYLEALLQMALLRYTDQKELQAFYEDHVRGSLITLSQSGRFVQAEKIFELLWKKVCEDQESPLYALALRDWSGILNDAGEYLKGMELSGKALDAYLRIWGEKNEKTWEMMQQHAHCLIETGDYSAALQLLETVRTEYESRFTENEEKLLDVLFSTARVYHYMERREEALSLYQQVLRGWETILKADDPNLGVVQTNIAVVLSDLKRYEEARQMTVQMLEKQKRILGEDHPAVLSALENLAIQYHKQERPEEALKLYEQVLEKKQTVFGDEHPETIRTLHNKAVALAHLGREEESLALRERVLEIFEIRKGKSHPDTLLELEVIAGAQRKLGKTERAAETYLQLLERRRALLGEDDAATLQILRVLSSLYMTLERYEDAIRISEYLLKKERELSGEQSPELVSLMFTLASLYYLTDRMKDAADVSSRALPLFERRVVEDPDRYLGFMLILIRSYERLDAPGEALKKCEECKAHLGAEHERIPVIDHEMARIREQMREIRG